MDFKRIRMQVESEARLEKYKERESYEVTLQEIWKYMEHHIGLNAIHGIALEEQFEMKFCYANPYIKELYAKLQAAGKRIVITSDMYLPREFLDKLLENNGYMGYEKLYVSCEYLKSKGDGKLYQHIKNEIGEELRYAHIGDNEHSDVKMANKAGFHAYHYPNINGNALLYRPYDMSPIIGGAYRGILDNHLYCGQYKHSMTYEYGYIYGGLFITGYCHYIHEFCRSHNIDKVLFLSRDGEIIKREYDKIYPEESTEYVYWSRLAATKLMAKYDQYDYFRRFLDHKVNQENSIAKIFQAMEIECLLKKLPEELLADDNLTDKNIKNVKAFLRQHWTEVLAIYQEQQEATKQWYLEVLSDSKRIAMVDIGWAGSGAIALDCLIHKEWKLNCECYGLVAGTNTLHNYEPDATETFFQSGMLQSYLYSFSHNRDLMKLHDANKGYNIFWELLTSSPQPSFQGFYRGEDGEVKLQFAKPEKNPEGIQEIQDGIDAFVDEYLEHFGDFPFMFNISGRDAYAPMIVAASYKEAYLNKIEKQFQMEIGVGN